MIEASEGRRKRYLQLIRLDTNSFGLNTESNTREVVIRYLERYGFRCTREFDDEISFEEIVESMYGNSPVRSRINTRDLLALRPTKNHLNAWIWEFNGHTAAEHWDFFHKASKQIQRILTFREKLLNYESAREAKNKIILHCALGLPNFPVRLNRYCQDHSDRCYTK